MTSFPPVLRMGDAQEKKLQAKYAKEWLELKHLLIGKHFAGKGQSHECGQFQLNKVQPGWEAFLVMQARSAGSSTLWTAKRSRSSMSLL